MANKKSNTEIFTEIYKNNMWGGEEGEFWSGSGSHNEQIDGYAIIIASFIKQNNINQIIEIGCGDFYVTKNVLAHLNETKHNYNYVGYDIVKDLISKNKMQFESQNVKFFCKDSCTQNILSGELLIIRQVLQHLDNESIEKIVNKFNNYKFIIVTEHQPSVKEGIIYNKDKVTDGNIRLESLSGIYLEYEPFNCKIDSLLYAIEESVYGIEASINTYLIIR